MVKVSISMVISFIFDCILILASFICGCRNRSKLLLNVRDYFYFAGKSKLLRHYYLSLNRHHLHKALEPRPNDSASCLRIYRYFRLQTLKTLPSFWMLMKK